MIAEILERLQVIIEVFSNFFQQGIFSDLWEGTFQEIAASGWDPISFVVHTIFSAIISLYPFVMSFIALIEPILKTIF